MKKRRFVDLSIYLENDVISDPVPFGPKMPDRVAAGPTVTTTTSWKGWT